jgi:hypothetical protein
MLLPILVWLGTGVLSIGRPRGWAAGVGRSPPDPRKESEAHSPRPGLGCAGTAGPLERNRAKPWPGGMGWLDGEVVGSRPAEAKNGVSEEREERVTVMIRQLAEGVLRNACVQR